MRVTDIFTPQDMGGLDDGQTKALDQYLIANGWRAVALAANGRIGISTDRPSEQDHYVTRPAGLPRRRRLGMQPSRPSARSRSRRSRGNLIEEIAA